MTSKEVKEAIERLRKLSYGRAYTSTEVVNAVSDGGDWVGCLIDILEQADPETHVELPKDVDGECVHVGDRMVLADGGEPFEVEAIGGNLLWFFDDGLLEHHSWESYECRHYKPMVEDVLWELLCTVDKETFEDDARLIVRKYADRLREMMDSDK